MTFITLSGYNISVLYPFSKSTIILQPGMIVTEEGNIKQTPSKKDQPPALRIFMQGISYLFHPLFIPTYIFIWLAQRFPFEFSGITPDTMMYRYISIFWMTAFFPAFAVFLLYKLKFVDSIFLNSKKERIIPYIITMFFYWWMYYLSRNFIDQPLVLKMFYLGIFIASAAGLIFNNFLKISMHAIAVSSAFTLLITALFYYNANLGIDLSICTLITGLVITARSIVSDHTSRELSMGLATGIICQLIAAVAVL